MLPSLRYGWLAFPMALCGCPTSSSSEVELEIRESRTPYRSAADSNNPRDKDLGREQIERRLQQRLVVIEGSIDDTLATTVIAQLLYLENLDAQSPIRLHIDSPGGVVTSSIAIYDTVRDIQAPVHTHGTGQAVGTAALLLAAGHPGSRTAHSNCSIELVALRDHGHETGGAQRATEIQRLSEVFVQALAQHCDRSAELVRDDLARGLVLDAQGARDYGLVDAVLDSERMKRNSGNVS